MSGRREPPDDGGSDRRPDSPANRLRERVTFFERVWSGTGPNPADDVSAVDVADIEKRIREEQRKRHAAGSPKIEVKLRHVVKPVPHQPDSSDNTAHSRLFSQETFDGGDAGIEESFERHVEEGDLASGVKFIKFERMTVKKTVREVTTLKPTFSTVIHTESRSGSPSIETQFLTEERSETPHEWYSEYRQQSLLGAPRRELLRSKSEFDSHIAEKRDEQERVQKKTFVNWINSYLSKRVPPLRVDDLIHDLRDGTKLLALLEVLSGERLPMERGRVLRRPHFLSNANTALRFLAGKRIKLVNINAADLVDGRPPVVLGLIWTIILYFQIEENSRALEYLSQRYGSQSSLESAATHSSAAELRQEKWKQGARKTLLQWVANALPKDAGINVTDFGPSWRDGIAFLAIIDAIKANLINLAAMKKASNKQRLETAFSVAENELGIARLLDAEDVDVEKPDEKSIMTYVAQFLHKYPEPKSTGPDAVAAIQHEYNDLLAWLYNKIEHLRHQHETNTLSMNYLDYAACKAEVDEKELIYMKLKQLVESQSMITITMDSWRELQRLWTTLESHLRQWLWLLDSNLPGDFGVIGDWLAKAECLLYFDEIPTTLDEKTAGIISNKIEEHSIFFADLPLMIERFENAKHSPFVQQVPAEQLMNMEHRLHLTEMKAPERKARLKFLEHKCCLVAFLNLTQAKLRSWTVKYTSESQVQALLDDYQNFVSRNKIFQEFNKAFVDIQQVIEDYKRICNIDAKEAREIDRFVKDIADTWKHVSMEVRCVQSMLEEVILFWQRWTPGVAEFESWLDVAHKQLNAPEEERMEFFQDITIWRDKHQLLTDTISFLVATCDDQVGTELKNKYTSITNQWEVIFNEVKQYMHAGDILRHRKDYKAGIESLSQWLRHAEQLLNQQPMASTGKIKEYGEQLNKLQSEIESVEELFKNVSKTFQSMITDLPREEVDKIMNTLKKEKEALVKVRALIPVKLHLYHQLLVQQESLESGQREISTWLDQAEDILSKITFEGGREVIERQMDIHKSFFSRTMYYKSMLESKNKVFQQIVKSVDVDKSVDTSESVQTMRYLNDRFANVSQTAHQYDLKLQEVLRCWNNFTECERNISDWLHHAETLLSEKHVENKQSIEYHKNFFTQVNEKLIQDMIQTGRDLLNCVPNEEQQYIVDTIERIQRKWQDVLSFAPLHLMRLEFRLDETVFQQYMKEIDKEIIYEQQAFNQSDDADGVLLRNEEYFKNQGKILHVERCLQNLKKITVSYAQQNPNDHTIAEALRRCEEQWESSAQKVDSFRQQLQQIPAKWEAYHTKFNQMVSWMDHVDETMKNIVKEVDSAEAFEKEKTIFQTICREADYKREDMKWLVQTLDLLSSHSTEQEASEEQNKLENLISRYKNLIPTIEITMVKTETYTRCYTYRREVHEVICILERVKDETIKDENIKSLKNVETMIIKQQSAVNQLDQHRPVVMSILQKGKDLMKDTNTPAFVQEDVQNLESGWNDTYTVATDKLYKLRDTQKVWSNFEYQKEELLSDLNKVQNQIAYPLTEGGVTNLSRELNETNIMNENLQKAKEEKIPLLKSTCADLCVLTSQEQMPALEKEVKDIEVKLNNVQENIQEKVQNLEKYSSQWKTVEEKLNYVNNWVTKESPNIVSQIQSDTITPEERVKKCQELQTVLADKLHALHVIYNDANQLSRETQIQDTNKLKAEISKLEKNMVEMKKMSDNHSKVVENDLANWQKYQAGLQEIKPWVEESENRVATGFQKPGTLQEAIQLQQQAKLFLDDCDHQLTNLQILSTISHQMSGKGNAPDEIDAVHSRWAVVNDMAEQWKNKLEKLVTNWQVFDADAGKLESWLVDGEKVLEKRIINVETPQVEKLERELSKLKSFGNEISQQQAKIVALTQNSDAISHSLTPEGANLVKVRVSEIKQRTNTLADSVRSKIHELSDKIIERQEFQTKLHNFENWMGELKRKIEHQDQVSTDRVEPALQLMHTYLQEHAEKQAPFTDIYNEIKQLTLTATPEESRALSEAYTNIVENYQNLEKQVQGNKILLQKWSELMNWYEETKQQLGHIKYQIDGPKQAPEVYDKLKIEIENIQEKVPTWKSNVVALDIEPAMKVTDQKSGRILLASNLVKEIELKSDTLKAQICAKKDNIEKISARWDKFNTHQNEVAEVIQNAQHALSEVSQNPTPYDKESIEATMKKLDALENDFKDKQLARKQLREEGLHLMREDQTNMGVIQNTLSAADGNWEQVNNAIRDMRNRYSVLSATLQELANFKVAYEREVARAEQLMSASSIVPTDYMQANQALDKAKKSLEILKRSKSLLEQMDLIKQSVLKQASAVGGFDTKPLEDEFLESQARLEKANDAIIKKIQDLESQVIIWRQIDDSKNQILNWLSETGQSLQNATENLELRFGQNRLTKYKEELPIYTGMRNGIQAKCEQLINLNKGVAMDQMSSLVDYLDNEFAVLKDIADSLETAASSLQDQEKELRKNIKTVSDNIGKLREEIIKCDDMSGDNAKILERLRTCQACKEQLLQSSEKIDNLIMNVSELNANYPGFSDSITPKELNALQKRFDGVLIHANKIEATLVSFLKKLYGEKLAMFVRMIKGLEEKTLWCSPESGSDKYNLEVKMASILDIENALQDCSKRFDELQNATEILQVVEEPKALAEALAQRLNVKNDFDKLVQTHAEIKDKLKENIELWQQYETMSDNISTWLKDVENTIRHETINQLDINNIDKKIQEMKELNEYFVVKFDNEIKNLTGLSDKILTSNPDSRVGQYVNHLVTRYQTVSKFTPTYLERLNDLKKSKEKYEDDVRKFKDWLKNANIQIQEFASLTSGKPNFNDLERLNRFTENKDFGQTLLNNAIVTGESLFSGITPENREHVRNELRGLRDSFEQSIDKVNKIVKDIETIINKRSSFDETFNQVEKWITDKQREIGDTVLYPTLPEKKANLHSNKMLLQDVLLHQNILKQLSDKVLVLPDEDIHQNVETTVSKYGTLSGELESRITTGEKIVDDHESYMQAFEAFRDWFNGLNAESVMVDFNSVSEKEDAENKLATLERLLAEKDKGSKAIADLNNQLQVVLQNTAQSGHPVLLNDYNTLKRSWDSFLRESQECSAKLEALVQLWNENYENIDNLDAWLKQKESQVRDQSLKNNLESKKLHLEKLKTLEKDVSAKAHEFSTICDKNNSIEGDSELTAKTSKLATRYQTMKNTLKELISKYEIFVADHENFEKEHSSLQKWLSEMLQELQDLNEIVGDYAILQEKQNKARELFDNRNKKASAFEALLGQGEKLYTHTSPDGREIVRQQIRQLRTQWDTFGDNLQDTVNKLDQCLLQFSDFSVSQEQLTKWLKDVERAMQKHTELKSTLQEKRAQLQNHKLMHQEIMTHQQLVEAVCDKAQQLVDQTHDASLNVYLQSIKQLFQNIVSKSQNLQDNLEECVNKHEILVNEIQIYKDWLNQQNDRNAEFDNVTGEKGEIIRKLGDINLMKGIEKDGTQKLDKLRNIYSDVAKSTSQEGNTLISAEIDSLQAQLLNLVQGLANSEKKLQQAEKQWNSFESGMDHIIIWLKETENKFRDQGLYSNAAEKEDQLKAYIQLRDQIHSKEKEVDKFVDESHNLIQMSGIERLKPLVSQVSSRYQQLHAIAKEAIVHWTELVSDHKKYNQLLEQTDSWLKPLEDNIMSLTTKNDSANSLENKGNKIQVLLLERENGDHKLTLLSSAADKILPDTSANGRESVRLEIRNIRERWEKLNEAILQQQKDYESQTLQWSNYQDMLQQTLSWLDEKEKILKLEESATWNSPQDIKSKLLKNKTILQEITSHKRVIEAVTDKAKIVSESIQSAKINNDSVKQTIASIWDRYKELKVALDKIISGLEDCYDVCQQFSDQQKQIQDYQKQLWERLQLYSDFTGSKSALQSKLKKVQELLDSLPNGSSKIKLLSEHIESHSNKLPIRAKETMSREVSTLLVDFEKFTSTVNDIKRGIEERLQQWTEYENTYDRLQQWLGEAELTLKAYTPMSTLEEKTEQLNKYQGLIKSIEYRESEMTEIISLADLLEQVVVVNLKKGEAEFDKLTDELNELIESSNETRISVNVQQMTSRFQSIQSTAKEIVKKCEQAVTDHMAYQEKYKQCSDWIQAAQVRFEECKDNSRVCTRDDIIVKSEGLKELLAQKPSAVMLLNNTHELGEKLYPSTSQDGREIVEQQLLELQQSLDSLYDSIGRTQNDLQSNLNKWSSFEEGLESIRKWLLSAEKSLPKEIELKATLDEKRNQLNVYRSFLQDALSHMQDITDLENRREFLPEKNENIEKELQNLKQRHKAILERAQSFVEAYEAIVNTHQQYTKSVMNLQEWVEATHNTVVLWGDCELERVSLCSNCEKLKTLQLTLSEEKSRIDQIRILGEKVLPGTISGGQINITSQIDTSHQEWEGLVSFIQSTIQSLENKLQQWNEYELLKDQCLAWIRATDNKLHAVDLTSTLDEKKNQFEELKELQGEVRAKELEIDNVTERAQLLYKGVMGTRIAQISDLAIKYQQLSQKVKDLASRWQQYVKTHQEFETNVAECLQWFEDIKEKLIYCADLNKSSQDDLENKLVLIQNLLLTKDEGFVKVQSAVELAQNVLANTAPAGHEDINNTLVNLQEEWSNLVSRMIEIKNLLDDSITKWAGFLELVQVINKSNVSMENALEELYPYQSTLSEKRAQLEKLKSLEEKARCDKIEVDNLKGKANEMLASGQQSQAASQAQEVLNKFDNLYDKIKKLLFEREAQYRDHRLYKEASDDLISWLSRAREKVPSLKSRPLSDKLAIENSVAPLEALINKQAQGELLLEHLQHTGEVVLASTSPDGQTVIRNEMKALKESFESLFNEIKQQKEQLETTVSKWRDYKDEYERLSDWLQQIDILIKNHKLAMLSTAKEKENQVAQVKEILDKLEKGKADLDAFNESASVLLTSHLDSYVTNQLRHLNSRYQVQVNLAKDVLKKVETNYEQHKEYDDKLAKAKKWMEDAWEITRSGSEAASTSSKEALQKRLEQIQDLLRRREEGQNLIHATVNSGEKVLRNTKSDAREQINNDLKELQADWDRLVKKMTTAKVHLETSLLQWADYSSSYSQLQQWITDREAKLQEVCEQKVAKSKKGQERAGLTTGLSLGERKATLRQTNNIVQDIVSFEPMIQSVTSKASELMQEAPASEITNKYETLSKQARDLYAKQKETVEQHQAFIDAGNDFVQWIRNAKEKLGKCSEPTGDKESLSSKISQLTILESDLPEGQKKLEKALEQGEIACTVADTEDKEVIEEEVALMQEEYDTYVEQLTSTKTLVEQGIVKWTEYEDQYKEALDWLSKTEIIVQTFNKLQNNLEQKKNVLEEFQGHLQTLFDWQSELDKLNMRAQSLLETCADTRISNGITQLTTKYNALLSLAKEIMRRLELHYQEHQQHNALYGECQDWLDRTRDKLNECADLPNTLQEVNAKLNTVRILRQSLEQGQNKLRYVLELKEKIIMNTEQAGAAKIQEDTESLKQEFDKLMVDVQDVRNKLTNRAAQFDELYKMHKLLTEWFDDIIQKIQSDDSFLNDLSEKKAKLEKFKTLLRDINAHEDMVNKIKVKFQDDNTLQCKEIVEGLNKYANLKKSVNDTISNLEDQVNIHIQFKDSYDSFYDWVRNGKQEIQQCSDSHGEKELIVQKQKDMNKVVTNMPQGEKLLQKCVELSNLALQTTGNEGQDAINQEIKQLKIEWDNLQHLCKDTKKVLEKCMNAWQDFTETSSKMKSWEDEFGKKLTTVKHVDKMTPEHLEKCRDLLEEALSKKHVLEELNDRCENLMELSACSWVRDQTVALQSTYSTLLTTIQGLVSNVEKNLSDHTEFQKAKQELQVWLETAHGTVQDSIGVGDIETTKDKLKTIKLVTNRMTEGHHLLAVLQDSFTKAINNTPPEKQEALREDMKSLHESWDQLKINLNSITAQLKAAINKWEDFEDAKTKFIQWLTDTEESLSHTPDTKGELGEMKTLLEKYKHIQDSFINKKPDLEHLKSEGTELSSWAKKPNVLESIHAIEKRCNALNAQCLARKIQLELEMQDYNTYHQSLQDTEKWLLQISFQLMAHNSLYITNREQTEEQLAQHVVLLDDIQKYQSTLDDLKALGQAQINRYVSSTPGIKPVIEKQLKNVNDSHQSLLATALQIEKRLREGLAKFKEYEDTLESIMINLDSYEPAITELDVPVESLPHGHELLESARVMHNKLQMEKSRLAAAVQACEAAAASVSRPSSPADTAPLPIPQRELYVRARLEDLIDQNKGDFQKEPEPTRLMVILQNVESPEFNKKMKMLDSKVQSYMSTLSETVNDMEEARKQRTELEDWINTQSGVVNDWLSNPTKLRPEAAKQEIASMNDMMVSLAEKKSKLLTDMSNAGFEDEPDLEKALDDLEDSLRSALQKELNNQAIIENFRQKSQELHEYLDNMLKRMEVTDKGSGLSCPQKLSAIVDLNREFADSGAERLDNVKAIGSEVISIVSNLESQQVEEQLKSVDRRFNDISKRLQRKAQVLDITHKAIDGTRQDIADNRAWMQKNISEIKSAEPLGFESKVAKERQKKLMALLKDADSKKTLIDTIEKKVSNIQNELEPNEQTQLENALAELASEQKQLSGLIKQEIEKVGKAADDRKRLENDIEKAQAWIKAKLTEVRKISGYIPLKAVKVEKDILENKGRETEVKDFKENLFNDVIKQGNTLLKECSAEDRTRLQSLLDTLTTDFNTLKNECSEKLTALNDLWQGRIQFESDLENCHRWLNEAEVGISAELRTSTLPLLEEQLGNYEKLAKESQKIESVIASISDQAKAILPTLSEADKLQLNEQINVLKDKFSRINSVIQDKIKFLQANIKEYKDAAAKIAAALQFMTDIQNQLKNLNKPIGSKVEDVQGVLQAYEKILNDLKANKANLCDLQGGNLHDLQDILTQQDDLINAIEDQIAKLKHLLVLREQFLALVNEILAFIAKYTTIVADVEKLDGSSEDKIKRYDDIILKIQECEATLAAATDKGQQIAAEGTAVDRNNITEQIQSLKQQLLTLRRAVENQRQQHEKAAAEHKKLASELTEILQWLHDNEATVQSRPLLNRDIPSTDKQITEHHGLAKNVNKYLDRIKKLQSSMKHDDGMSSSLLEMISDANSLVSTLPRELEERESYLQNNKKYRQNYFKLVERLELWANESKIRLELGKDGTDFDNIISDLEEHKGFFNSTEGPMKELVGTAMQEAVDKIWPSLNAPEQEELSKEHQKYNQLFKNTLNSAKSRQAQLEQDVEIWKDFCDLQEKIKKILNKIKIDDEPITSLTNLQQNLQKVQQAQTELESQQPLLDVLRERARELVRSAAGDSGARVETSARELDDAWAAASGTLAAHSDALAAAARRWTALDEAARRLELALAAVAEKARHVDLAPPSRQHAIEARTKLQDLKSETKALEEVREDVVEQSTSVITFLKDFSNESARPIENKVKELVSSYNALCGSLDDKLKKLEAYLSELEQAFKAIDTLREEIEVLLAKVKTFYVFGENLTETEKSLEDLKNTVEAATAKTKKFIDGTRKQYGESGASVPADLSQELSSLELLTESLHGAMEEKGREAKRARTLRTDYAAEVEALEAWLRSAELAARDRTLEPQPLAERLASARREAAAASERAERVAALGRGIGEGTRDARERQVLTRTASGLAEQLVAVCAELEARRAAAGDACDAWARFLRLLEAVRAWVATQKTFLAQPLHVTSLDETRHRLNDYSLALKSCKQQTKNLGEMAKELENIEQVASVGELPGKLEEAETSKVEVEKQLMQRNALLQELTEEWEQCERKMKDVTNWIEKTRQTLDSSQNKKKPLRDQHALREKILGDVPIQKTKISISVEKLQVHFRSGVEGSPGPVEETARRLQAELDCVGEATGAQAAALAGALAQLDAYAQEVQRLRGDVLRADQQLRAALAPNYTRDADTAHRHQQEYRDKIKLLQSKIEARRERIKLIVQRGTPDLDPLTDT